MGEHLAGMVDERREEPELERGERDCLPGHRRRTLREVDRDEAEVPAATVKAWVAHLRSHGWADADLALVWLTRAKQGVTR